MSKAETEKLYTLKFLGPFYPVEKQGKFRFISPDLKNAGLYMFTFEYNSGFIVWFDGFSTRNVSNRLNDHIKNILRGSYSILDVNEANAGRRVEIWHGFYFTKNESKKREFDEQRQLLLPSIFTMIKGLHIFFVPLNESRRVLSRIEAAIMNQLYNSSGITSDFPDKGMHLEPRWPEETAFRVIVEKSPIIHGLPAEFEA